MEVFRDFSGNNRGSFDHWADPRPHSLDDLRRAILDAENGIPALPVHAVGSAWAFSAPAYCNGVEINTSEMSAFAELDWVQQAVTGPAQAGGVLVAVPAGITVHDLDLALNGEPRHDHGPGIPAVPWETARRHRGGSWPTGRFVLPTHGGAGGQTVGGALATGTHGGDAIRGAIGDFVRAMILVGSGGVVRLIEPSAPHTVCDAAAVRAQVLAMCGPGATFEAIADDQVFNAALVAVGRLGVIYAYVYEVADEHTQFVFERRTRSTWEDTKGTVPTLLTDAVARDDFLQVVVVPVRGSDGRRACFVTKHTLAPKPGPSAALTDAQLSAVLDAQIEAAGLLFDPASGDKSFPVALARGAGLGDFGQLMCSHQLTPELQDLQTALIVVALLLPFEPILGGIVPGLPPLPPIDPLLALVLSVLLLAAAAEIGTIGPDHIVGDIIAGLLDAAERIGLAFIVGMVIDAALGSGQSDHLPAPNDDKPWLIHGTRAQIADFFDYDHDCYRGDSVELFFDAHNIVEEMDRILALFDDAVARGNPPGGYLSLRFLGRTRATLGMNTFPQTCSVEVSLLRGVAGNAELISNLQGLTLPAVGHVHWGQENDLTAAQVISAYGVATMNRWWEVVTRLEGGSMTFSNDFTLNHGLDVPMPDAYDGWTELGIVSTGSPSVIPAGGGRPLAIFANVDGTVRTTDVTDAGTHTPWRTVVPTPVARNARPAAIRSVDHRSEVFIRGADGRLWHTYENHPGSDFAGWDTLGGAGTGNTISGDPCVAAHTDGRLEVFAQESADATRRLLRANAETVNGLWSSLDPTGDSHIQSPPSAALRVHTEPGLSGTDQLVVVTALEGGDPRVTTQIGPAGDSPWVPLEPLGDGTQTVYGANPGTPIVISSGGPRGAAHAYLLGVDGQIHESAETDTVQAISWTGWTALPRTTPDRRLAPGSRLAAPATAVQWLIGLSIYGHVLCIRFDAVTDTWADWSDLGGPFAGDVAAGELDDGQLAIVARRQRDDQLLIHVM